MPRRSRCRTKPPMPPRHSFRRGLTSSGQSGLLLQSSHSPPGGLLSSGGRSCPGVASSGSANPGKPEGDACSGWSWRWLVGRLITILRGPWSDLIRGDRLRLFEEDRFLEWDFAIEHPRLHFKQRATAPHCARCSNQCPPAPRWPGSGTLGWGKCSR